MFFFYFFLCLLINQVISRNQADVATIDMSDFVTDQAEIFVIVYDVI